jgi:hypothetical protein
MLGGARLRHRLPVQRVSDPPTAAARLEQAVLILAGGSDYRVTETDLANQRRKPDGRANVRIQR